MMAEIDNLVINVEVTGNTSELHDIAILIEGIDKKTEKATSKMASFGASIKKMLKSAAFIKTMSYLGKSIKKSMEYTESLNLFTVAMGDYAKEAQKYAETVSEVMGIDPAEWLKAQGTFNILATGFGVAADKAAVMSKNLTQLGYDLSSFYNINVQDAMLKLQSGLAGELEPLRRLGYDLSVARLQQEAYALGIEKSITSMTQAEKSMLRYHAIMTQVTEVQGDMARTLESPANQTRILKAQIDQLTRSIGNTLIPLVNALLPYMIALAQVAREAADAVAAFFGYELPTVDFTSVSKPVGDISTGLEDATKKAKELKRSLMGFDEINKLSDTSSGSTDTSSSGAGFDMELPEYNFLGEQLKADLDAVKQKLQDLMPLIAGVAAAFATWKLSSFLKDVGIATGRLEALKYAAAITVTVAGIAIEWKGIISAFRNGLNKSNFGEIAAGAVLTAIGGALLGKMIPFVGAQLGAAGGAIVAGIPMIITGIYDALVNGLNWLNATLIPLGTTLTGAGIGAIIGALGGPIGAGMGALIGLAVGALTDLGILIYEKWDEITAWCSSALSSVGQFFVDLWGDVVAVWESVATWFDTTVITPIVKFFTGLWTDISTAASECWNEIVLFFTPAVEWFSELFGNIFQTVSDIFYNIGVIASGCWEVIKEVWSIVSGWVDENVITPVATFFSDLWADVSGWASEAWEGIKSVFLTISTWIDTNVIQPVSKFFTDLWSGFTKKAEEAWEGVKTAFNNVGTFFKDTFEKAWQDVVNVFSVAGEIFTDIKEGVLSGFKAIVNGIISGINKVVAVPFNGINTALNKIKGITIVGIKPFSGLKTISVPEIPLLASGGQVNEGQMFIAREAGPELVGSIGRRTTVANNEQIIEGIYRGVYQAMRDAGTGNNGGGQTVVVMLPNGDVLGETFVNWHNGIVKQTGNTPLLV